MFVVVPNVERANIALCLEQTLIRAAQIGIKVVVWDSPQARHIPLNYSVDQVMEQMMGILRFCGEIGLHAG